MVRVRIVGYAWTCTPGTHAGYGGAKGRTDYCLYMLAGRMGSSGKGRG
jgi:hypothetical protein